MQIGADPTVPDRWVPADQHHPVFRQFSPFDGVVPGGFQLECFLGSVSRLKFRSLADRTDSVAVKAEYPPISEGYFEWISVLESVLEAQHTYTIFELGAGFGRWSISAAKAAATRKLRTCITAVEAEPVHFDWMRENFADNGLNVECHRLVRAAVTEKSGEVPFRIEIGPNHDPGIWYGQSVSDQSDAIESAETADYYGFAVHRHASGSLAIQLPAITLNDLLRETAFVDLIDMDIQGAEASVVRSSIVALNRTTKRMHIGTHGAEVERELRDLMTAHGWRCLMDYPGGQVNSTPFGPVEFGDGTQSWINPRMLGWRGRIARWQARLKR